MGTEAGKRANLRIIIIIIIIITITIGKEYLLYTHLLEHWSASLVWSLRDAQIINYIYLQSPCSSTFHKVASEEAEYPGTNLVLYVGGGGAQTRRNNLPYIFLSFFLSFFSNPRSWRLGLLSLLLTVPVPIYLLALCYSPGGPDVF